MLALVQDMYATTPANWSSHSVADIKQCNEEPGKTTCLWMHRAHISHILCAYFNVASCFLSTELIVLTDDLLQLAPELGVYVFHASYLQQSCLQSCKHVHNLLMSGHGHRPVCVRFLPNIQGQGNVAELHKHCSNTPTAATLRSHLPRVGLLWWMTRAATHQMQGLWMKVEHRCLGLGTLTVTAKVT